MQAEGDLHIDYHHTTEDTGIVIGEAVAKALGDRARHPPLRRRADPDGRDADARRARRFDRPYLVWKVAVHARPSSASMDTELFKEWFQALRAIGGITLHVETLYGENNHHIDRELLQGPGPGAAPGGRARSARRRRGALDQGQLVRAWRLAASVAVIDYGSGNLRSAERGAGARRRRERRRRRDPITADPEAVRRAEQIVLPGVGAFADCMAGLAAIPGMIEALDQAARRQARPFLGICVGMQLMASEGQRAWSPSWARLDRGRGGAAATRRSGAEGAADGLERALRHAAPSIRCSPASRPATHAYFVHSFHFRPRERTALLAEADYGGPVAAALGVGNIAGTQFHPEKSQRTGLRLLANFLAWRP